MRFSGKMGERGGEIAPLSSSKHANRLQHLEMIGVRTE